MRDLYSVLGVARDASDEEVKRAYRRLAKRLHPDVNPGKHGVEQQFKEATAAYELLSDPEKRKRYDRGEIDAEGRERGLGAGFGGFRPGGGTAAGPRGARGFTDFSIDEVLQEFLHRGRRGAARAAAEPKAQGLRIGFLEAALGTKRQVVLGDGRPVEVSIPPGIESGQKLRLKDEGAGDMLLEIEVEPHPGFTRKGRDIHTDVLVPLADAVLGRSIVVPTIHGEVTLKVPKGANTGATLRLRGKGITAGGATGDHYVKLKLALPEPADPELMAILEKWAKGR
jgi:DnaJ-class molecular chaperone